MGYETILLRKENGVGTICLNRPKILNPLNSKCFEEISSALADMSRDSGIRAVILKGEGNAFSAGGDIKEIESFPPGDVVEFRDFMMVVKKTILEIHSLEKPVIAAVNGLAYGAGFSLALACDVILASEKARFCQVFVHVGLAPDAGSTYFLSRMIGTARTFPLIFLGEPVAAQEAQAMGLISRVVPGEKLEEEAMALAKKLAQGPTRAMGLAKRLIYTGMGKSLSDQLDEEANVQTICRLTEDHREGLRAFKEKRSPRFQGK